MAKSIKERGHRAALLLGVMALGAAMTTLSERHEPDGKANMRDSVDIKKQDIRGNFIPMDTISMDAMSIHDLSMTEVEFYRGLAEPQ